MNSIDTNMRRTLYFLEEGCSIIHRALDGVPLGEPYAPVYEPAGTFIKLITGCSRSIDCAVRDFDVREFSDVYQKHLTRSRYKNVKSLLRRRISYDDVLIAPGRYEKRYMDTAALQPNGTRADEREIARAAVHAERKAALAELDAKIR